MFGWRNVFKRLTADFAKSNWASLPLDLASRIKIENGSPLP
jgi:hypothetical protein